MGSRDRNNEWEDNSYDAEEEIREQYDHCRLYIRNIPKGLSEEGLRTAFSKYGTVLESYVSMDPKKKYALVKYETPGEANLAMTKLNHIEPMKLHIDIAKKSKVKGNNNQPRDKDNTDKSRKNGPKRTWAENASVSSRKSSRMQDDLANYDDEMDNMPSLRNEDPDVQIKNLQLELQRLQLQEQKVLLRQQLVQLEATQKKSAVLNITTTSNRCILPDGRIVVRNVNERSVDSRDVDGNFAAGAGDSNGKKCTCLMLPKSWGPGPGSSGSSTPSTCVLCFTRNDNQAKSVDSKSDCSSNFDDVDMSKVADVVTESNISKMEQTEMKQRDIKCNFHCEEESDETSRLIQLRNCDYMDVVGHSLKIVIALDGYPQAKMRLRQMETFQRCLTDVINMQLKAGLLEKVPAFFDYYLNRGAIVCVCKDVETRDWMIRVSPGLQERMSANLILLKAKVKRLCLAVLKIPQSCWPATAQDAFKLLQYFNPTLKTELWEIYSQKKIDNVESTCFIIDRKSGEIIRGPTFNNVIDYSQMEFELSGYTEIYYENILSDSDLEDLCSVASRVKLLQEIKSAQATPRNNDAGKNESVEVKTEVFTEIEEHETDDSDDGSVAEDDVKVSDEKDFENNEVLNKLKDVNYVSEKNEILVWCEDKPKKSMKQIEREIEIMEEREEELEDGNVSVAMSEKSESDVARSRSSNLNIDSNRGIAYHRRTNYLHVESELKVAVTLEGYPQNKLEGTHIRRLKHLFKEQCHKDMKNQRFDNLIFPAFQDVYLSNGAVIYVCDSLETKDYLTELLPKLVASTGLRLTFRDVGTLVRYTRVVLRLPKEYANIESDKILMKLRDNYPGLKPDCWKYYSDVAGRQKRQFGVDPESLDVIKSPGFDPMYGGEKLGFRIIDRQKRDVSFEDSTANEEKLDDMEAELFREKVLKIMYVPIDTEIIKTPLGKIRTNHYSDLIADDLKLYVGPSDYPQTRIDEVLFHYIKRAFESVACDSFKDLEEETVPRFHDMYLFDGVIFVICQDMFSREWMERSVLVVNERMHLNLKSTEFRGAVGIISMVVKTNKDTDAVITVLQRNNPRLRTKYWRKISAVRDKAKIDVVLQIDKLSAQVITGPDFDKIIDGNVVQFNLGHLQSLLKPKASLEELTKLYFKRLHENDKENSKKKRTKTVGDLKDDIINKYSDLKIDQWDISEYDKEAKVCKIDELCRIVENNSKEPIVELGTTSGKLVEIPSPVDINITKKVIIKVPRDIVPESEDDLTMLFDILQDNNPGLNTELWKVPNMTYPGTGRYAVFVDRRSALVIQARNFDADICGEKLKFFF